MDDRELEPMLTFDSLWCPAPASLTLSSDEVHIWRASLGLTSSQVQKLEQTLTIDEIGRAARYYFPNDRRRFIISRGLLRSILSFYLNTEPDQLRFRYGTNGKPLLAAATGRDILSFNLSHSGELVLYAVTRSRRVGIDLERVRPDIEYEQIAVRFFSPHEIAVLQGLPTHVRPEAFFTCWTCKEAYIKAKGEGLSLPLNWFEVSVAPDEPVMIFHIRGDPQEASQWSLQQLNPGPGYVACLVVEGHNYRLKCWQYPEL